MLGPAATGVTIGVRVGFGVGVGVGTTGVAVGDGGSPPAVVSGATGV